MTTNTKRVRTTYRLGKGDQKCTCCLVLEVFTLLHEFLRIPPDSQWKVGIPWNFYGKHLAGASAIWVSFSMEILTFFQGIPMEMVGMREPLGMIPNGICGIPLEFHGKQPYCNCQK